MERIIKGSKRVETTVSVYYPVGRNLDEAHHTVCLDKRKKYINNAVVILTYPPPQKTLRLLKLLYFLRVQSITLRFWSRASLGTLAHRNCKRMLRSKIKDMLPVIRRVARSRTATEMNQAIKSLKNSEFWKIEKNYMMKYWLPLTEVSMVDMPLYGEIFIFYMF